MRFTRVLCSSPKVALQKARGVVEMYAVLLRQRASPVDWSCQEEYATPEGEEEEEEEEPTSATTMQTVAVNTGMGNKTVLTRDKSLTESHTEHHTCTHSHAHTQPHTHTILKHVLKYKPCTIVVGNVQCILTCFGCISLHQTSPFPSGVPECQCPCPWFPTPSSSTAHSWSPRTQPAPNQTTAALPSGFTHYPYPTGTTLSPGTIGKDIVTQSPLKTTVFSHSQPFEEKESSDGPASVINVPYSPDAVSVRAPVLMDQKDGQADKDLMYRSEASTTGPSVLSKNASVAPALGLPEGRRTFSSVETTAHGPAKGTLEAKTFESQHRYDPVLLGQEEFLRLEYSESKATKEMHRTTPKSTADNRDDFTMDHLAFMGARALRRREKYSSKNRIFPRDLRAKAKDIPSTTTAKSESEDTRTAHQDRGRSRHTLR